MLAIWMNPSTVMTVMVAKCHLWMGLAQSIEEMVAMPTVKTLMLHSGQVTVMEETAALQIVRVRVC
jgi:succinate dehydrogenase hydrophobic anchor subunit